jgi:hypothetical protein
MAETERQDKRPSCAWPVDRKDDAGKVTGQKPCGSEDRVYSVKGNGIYTGRARETPICEKHLPDVWKAWNVDSATPLMTQKRLER